MSKLEMSGFEKINTPLIPLGNGDATNSGCTVSYTGQQNSLPPRVGCGQSHAQAPGEKANHPPGLVFSRQQLPWLD